MKVEVTARLATVAAATMVVLVGMPVVHADRVSEMGGEQDCGAAAANDGTMLPSL